MEPALYGARHKTCMSIGQSGSPFLISGNFELHALAMQLELLVGLDVWWSLFYEYTTFTVSHLQVKQDRCNRFPAPVRLLLPAHIVAAPVYRTLSLTFYFEK